MTLVRRSAIFFCYGAIRFPRIGMFSFSHRECVKLQKDSLQNKMYLNSIFERGFVCVKRFQPIIRVENNSHTWISVLRRLRIDFVIRKLVRKQVINIHTALRTFRKI